MNYWQKQGLKVWIVCTVLSLGIVQQSIWGQGDDSDAKANKLFDACTIGDLTTVQSLIEVESIGINIRTSEVLGGDNRFLNMTPLMIAARHGHFEIVGYLFNQGADSTIRSHVGMNALHWAAAGGHRNVMEFMLSQGMNVNEPTRPKSDNITNPLPGTTALDITMTSEYYEPVARVDTIEFLISRGGHRLITDAPVPYSMEEMIVLLKLECISGNLISVANAVHLLGDADANIPLENGHKLSGATPIHIACVANQPQVVRLLLILGADPKKPFTDGTQAIHMAARDGRTDIARILLNAGVDVNTQVPSDDEHREIPADRVGLTGLTALMAAAGAGQQEMVRFLLDQGALTTLTTDTGQSAWDFATLQGHHDIATVIAEYARQRELRESRIRLVRQNQNNNTQGYCVE